MKNEFSHFSEHVLNTKLWFITNTSEILEYLPRKLLCEFADYLIKLTALKQQLSLDLETVSSESDILLITKSNPAKWVRYTKEIL